MSSESPRPQATVSTELLTRIVVLLVAVWDAFAGAVLLAFHGSSTGALGAGVTDQAGQRLLGAHLLVMVPFYVFLAVRFQNYRALFWVPFAAQSAVVLVIGYNMLKGDTSFGDGVLAFAVSLIFVALLGFVWITERRTTALLQMEQQQALDESRARLPGGAPDTQP